ncbi:MAG: efflux RND transporter permease subunit [Methylococcales bacterium]
MIKVFSPQQDGGRLIGGLQTDQGASFWAMQKKLFEFSDIVQRDPAVETVVAFAGSQQQGGNNADVFVVLKPHDQRSPIEAVMERLRGKLDRIPGARLFMFPAQELRIGGRPSYGSYDYALQSDDLALLREWRPKVVVALSKLPELKDANTSQQDKGQQIGLAVDREMASRYGVTAMIDTSLNDAFGQRQVSVIYNALNQYRVVMELAPEYWESPEALKQVYTSVPQKRLPNGEQVPARQIPLSILASFAPTNTPLKINHQGQFAAATVEFNLKPDVSLSQATRLIEQTMRDIGVPSPIQGAFQGSAKAFQEPLSNQPLLILAALITIYIVLGVLYESLIHPLAILSTLPSAGLGALLALMACDTEFSIIALIGVILLIGIVKRCDFSGLPAAFSPHHDDDPGGAVWGLGIGQWLWGGTSSTTGHCHCWRIDFQSAVDPLYHPGCLSLSGSFPIMVAWPLL